MNTFAKAALAATDISPVIHRRTRGRKPVSVA